MPLCVVPTEASKREPNMLVLGDRMSFGTFHSVLSVTTQLLLTHVPVTEGHAPEPAG